MDYPKITAIFSQKKFQFRSSQKGNKENVSPNPGLNPLKAHVPLNHGPFGDITFTQSQGFIPNLSQDQGHGLKRSAPSNTDVKPARQGPTLGSGGCRILTGNVSKTKEWLKIPLPFSPVHIVFGKLFCPMRKVALDNPAKMPKMASRMSHSALKTSLVLQDELNPVHKLRCVFYNIDRDLPLYDPGTCLMVVGKSQGDGSLLAVNYGPAPKIDTLQRLMFFSQRGIKLGTAQARKLEETEKSGHGNSSQYFPRKSNSSMISN